MAIKFRLSCKKNDGASAIIPPQAINVAGGGDESRVVSVSGFANLSADDTIEAWLRNVTGTENCVVEDITMSIRRITRVP